MEFTVLGALEFIFDTDIDTITRNFIIEYVKPIGSFTELSAKLQKIDVRGYYHVDAAKTSFHISLVYDKNEVTISALLKDDPNHMRTISRIGLLVMLHPDLSIMSPVTVDYGLCNIDSLDVTKPDDIIVLNTIIDMCSSLTYDYTIDDLLAACDKGSLIEHKMLIIRRLHEINANVHMQEFPRL